MQFQSMNISLLYMYRVYLPLYQNCRDSVVLISLNLMWNIRNEVDKTFVRTLVHQLKAHMKLNDWKWFDEMEQRNSEKNQKFLILNDKWFFCLLTYNSRADIITRYNFNQVRCFFFAFNRFHGLIGYTSKIHE